MSFLLCLARPIPTDGPEGTQRVSEHPPHGDGRAPASQGGPFQQRLAMSSPQRLPSMIEAVVALLRPRAVMKWACTRRVGVTNSFGARHSGDAMPLTAKVDLCDLPRFPAGSGSTWTCFGKFCTALFCMSCECDFFWHGESMDRNHSACFRNPFFVCLLVGRSVRLSVVPSGPLSELCGRLECL